jgi:hypothetical protein
MTWQWYLDNFNNRFLNKYKKLNRKESYRYIFLLINWWWFEFNVILLSFDSLSKIVKLKPLQSANILMVFHELASNNEIPWNLNLSIYKYK